MSVTGTVISNEELNAYTHHFKAALVEPKSVHFISGQFMMIDVAPNVKRAYSIANPQSQQDVLEFIVDTRPGGPGSTYAKTVAPGDKITLSGPFGHLKVKSTPNPKVFIANGCGIPPLKSMIDTLLEQNRTEPVTLLWGMRYLDELYLKDHFESLRQNHPNFTFTYCVSKINDHPGERSYCASGHVTDIICQEDLAKYPDAEFYMCGKREMVSEIVDILKKRGIDDQSISSEGY